MTVILNKKHKADGVICSEFRILTHYKANVTKTESRSQKIDIQWNRLEFPEENPCSYHQLVSDSGAKNSHMGKIASSINGFGEARHPHGKE